MKKYKIFFAPILVLFLLVSCNKKGCSDPTADNYVKKVKKAQDRKCQYNGEGICGEGISFCMEINGIKKTGTATVSQPTAAITRLIWESGPDANAPSYSDLWIEFPTGTQDKLEIGAVGNSKNFQASYSSLTTGIIEATSGSMLIKKNNVTDGIIATFSLTLSNGTQIKEGNIYKAK
jgi:hypothetical protein|tara:strand:- start:9793 stop:10323 length:531 start_codon:yes stop_codon:yes gene_type:complete